MSGPQIAELLGMPTSTVGVVLRRLGLARLRDLEAEQPEPNERGHPGELIHIDVKKLARIRRPGHRIHGDCSKRAYGAGWEFVHVCVDDATCVAYVGVLEDGKATTAVGFLRRAAATTKKGGDVQLPVATATLARLLRIGEAARLLGTSASRISPLLLLRTRRERSPSTWSRPSRSVMDAPPIGPLSIARRNLPSADILQ